MVGAGSIGQAIARRVGAGKITVLADYSIENAKRAAKTLEDAGFETRTISMDLGDKDVDRMRREYKDRRDFMVPRLNALGLKTHLPQGAFYLFSDVRPTGMTSDGFAMTLLKDYGVACVPGEAFGECGRGFVRMSYATGMEKLKVAIERIGRCCKERSLPQS